MKRLGFLPGVEDEIKSVRYLEMVALTVQVDEKLAERAKRAAERRKITVDAMVGQYFAQLPNDDRAATTNATDQLIETLRQLSRPMGGKPWANRDELYER